jgi:hypothetical protein
MISDRDIWAAALLIVKRYGDDAMLEAAERADQMLDEGDVAGAETWAPDPERMIRCDRSTQPVSIASPTARV